jgi:hypothetical protein
MLRAIAAATCLSAILSSPPERASADEPRGLTFSQGGGFHYAPREHYITVPMGHRLYSYGPPMTLGFASPYGFGLPMGSGWPITYGTLNSPGYYLPGVTPLSQMVDSPMMAPVNALPANISPWGDLPEPKGAGNASERPVLPSSAAATLKARNLMAEGDQHFRDHEWLKAYSSYRQAVNAADDIAEAHLRYGIILTILRRYDRAELEFRRAVVVDPTLPDSEFTLEKLFGPDSRLTRNSIMDRLADWVNEGITDSHRLYILGVMMHFNQDERAGELLTAAYRLAGGPSYMIAFLPKARVAPAEEPPKPGLDEEPAEAPPKPEASASAGPELKVDD